MPLRPLTLALAALALAACGTTGGGTSEAQGSLMDALMATHAHSRAEAQPQQAAFEERIVVGMTPEDVVRTASAIAREFRSRSSRPHTVRAAGGAVVTSSQVTCFQGGEPRSRTPAEEGGAEAWEYPCFDRVYVLTFREGRLAEVVGRPLRAGTPPEGGAGRGEG